MAVGGVEIAVGATHIPTIIDGSIQVPGGVGQQLAHRQRRPGSTDTPLVAANPFIAGKAEQHYTSSLLCPGSPGLRLLPRQNFVMPAQGQFAIFRILPPLPERHVGRVELIHGGSPRR